MALTLGSAIRLHRAMRDLLSWNIYLVRVAGVQVRLHAFFLLLTVLLLAARERVPLPYGLTCLALLLASVAWHEFAHCFAAVKTGGSADQILLWPLGGLVQVNTTAHDPREEWPTAAGGIVANLLICVFVAPILMVSGSWASLHLNPLSLPKPTEDLNWQAVLGALFWINWLLALANLLPAYPLDGARLLRTALWHKLGYRSAALQTVRAGKMVALLLFALALLVHDRYPAAMVLLSLLAIMVFFWGRQEVEKLHDSEGEEALFGYDFSQGYTSLERATSSRPRSKVGFLRRWLAQRREDRLRRQREIEEFEDLRVDDVLCKLHESGISGLSHEERSLLERVSARYRNRQHE